jgi:hypothetical protein
MTRLIDLNEHSGVYRLLGEYPKNQERLCEEYEVEFINGNPVPKPGSKYTTGFPINMIFDYSISTRG